MGGRIRQREGRNVELAKPSTSSLELSAAVYEAWRLRSLPGRGLETLFTLHAFPARL